MKILKNVSAKDVVFHIVNINDDTFLTGEYNGNIELINKNDLRCLSQLNLGLGYTVIN